MKTTSTNRYNYHHALILILLFTFTLGGCITTVKKPTEPNQPPVRGFSTFDNVILKHINSTQKTRSNYIRDAIKEIDEHLIHCIRSTFPNVSIYKEALVDNNPKTIIIEPYINEIKCVSPVARLWTGAFAGSSAINIKVTFTDGTGAIIAQPTFYASASAHMGVFSNGGSDRKILKNISQDVCGYVLFNR
ncbi:MAG: hypothetical protein OEM02_08895 [Desulfobulbaceae bacterium]|nr:hypothetical protein [Desulfobulbaceae bacterium]